MPADPADIALYTTDGILLVSPTVDAVADAIKAAHINARSFADQEREMFFDDPADAQVLLDEAFDILSVVNPGSWGVELADSIGLGSTIPLTPTVPCLTVVDDPRAISTVVRVRAYATEMGTDRYAIELLGTTPL